MTIPEIYELKDGSIYVKLSNRFLWWNISGEWICKTDEDVKRLYIPCDKMYIAHKRDGTLIPSPRNKIDLDNVDPLQWCIDANNQLALLYDGIMAIPN